jgi:hypothetical protein
MAQLITIKPHQRRISLEANFMNYETNDLLYGLLYYYATYDGDKLYLSKRNYAQLRPTIYATCDFSGRAQLKRHLDKLIEKGLIAEEGNNYIFPQNPEDKYKLIDKFMIQKLTTFRQKQMLRIYTILLDWFLWKKQNHELYIFRNYEIAERLGYSRDNKAVSAMITETLKLFQEEGIISYDEYYAIHYTEDGKEIPVPTKTLYFVAESFADIQQK